MDKKQLVVKYKTLVGLACRVYSLPSRLSVKSSGKNNRVEASCALLKKTRIHFSGNNNRVILQDFARLDRVALEIHGDNNTVVIGPWSYVAHMEVCTEDDHNRVEIGERTRILGSTHLAALEGTTIRIGEECLFSSNIHFRTGDSHSVLDMTGKRINPSRDITVGDHVWIGTGVTCLKGAKIPGHSIVGAASVVTGQFETPNCVFAGVPAKVVKTDVDWTLQRLPVEDAAANEQQEEAK